MKHRILPDITRVGLMVIVAAVLLFASTPLALLLGEPALAPWGMFTGVSALGVALSHVFRRAMFPYVDLKDVATTAKQSPAGAGLLFMGVCFVLGCLLLVMGGAARAQELPPGAVQYLPTLKAEQTAHWPDVPVPSVLAGQVEQESCISLKHPRCWNPRAELRTDRERGVGFGQITRTSRFDALAEMRAQFPKELGDWSWDSANLYDPARQLRALILMDLRNFRVITDTASPVERLAMALTAYNGGLGGLTSDRRLCAGTKGCDPSRWFGHVERTSLKSRVAATGYGKSFFAINREYAPAMDT